jgi:hypothetical protein
VKAEEDTDKKHKFNANEGMKIESADMLAQPHRFSDDIEVRVPLIKLKFLQAQRCTLSERRKLNISTVSRDTAEKRSIEGLYAEWTTDGPEEKLGTVFPHCT